MKVINIDKHILRWAKHMHGITEEPLEGNMGQKNRVEVVYDKVKVEVKDQKNKDADKSSKFTQSNARGTQNEQESGTVIIRSKFKNTSDLPQTHTFEMERETAGVLTTSVSKGFTRSGNVGMTLDVPELISNVTGGFGAVIEVKEEEESKVNHALKWKVNSTVTVGAGDTTEAVLKIREEEKTFTFTAKVNLHGTVLVRVLDLTTGTLLKVVQNDIATLLSDIMLKQGRYRSDRDVPSKKLYDDLPMIPEYVCITPSDTKSPGRVVWPVEGKLHFRFGISQDVEVTSCQQKATNALTQEQMWNTPLFRKK